MTKIIITELKCHSCKKTFQLDEMKSHIRSNPICLEYFVNKSIKTMISASKRKEYTRLKVLEDKRQQILKYWIDNWDIDASIDDIISEVTYGILNDEQKKLYCFKVYELFASSRYYNGESKISAKTFKRANEILTEFINRDNNNIYNSMGYPNISEDTFIGYASNEGFERGIYYTG